MYTCISSFFEFSSYLGHHRALSRVFYAIHKFSLVIYLIHNSVYISEKAMATHSSILAWKILWTEGPGGLQSMGSLGVGHDFLFCTESDTTEVTQQQQQQCIYVEKAVAPPSSTIAWKIPWTEEPGRLQSMGSLRVRHN